MGGCHLLIALWGDLPLVPWLEKTVRLRNTEVLHAHKPQKTSEVDLGKGAWEMPTGGRQRTSPALALGHQLHSPDTWSANLWGSLRSSVLLHATCLHTYQYSSSPAAMGSTIKEREKKLIHCRAPQNIRIRRNPWSQQVQSTHFTEKHMEAHRKGKWGTCQEQSGA